jgi:hypothetical protein
LRLICDLDFLKKNNIPKLTNRLIEAIEPEKEDVIIRDSELKGFICKITPKGKRVYMLYYRTRDGRERRPSIGVHGHINCYQARNIAIHWLSEIAKGSDPSLNKRISKTALTITELSERYLKDYASIHKKPSSVKIVNPSVIEVGEYESVSEELRFKSTQLKAFNATIITNEMKADSAFNEYTLEAKTQAAEGSIPLVGYGLPSVSPFYGQLKSDERVSVSSRLQVTNSFDIVVHGHADLKGISITAGSLRASFGSLLLESVEDIISKRGYSFGLTIGLSEELLKKLPGIRGGLEKEKGHMVNSLARIIGEDETKIVVANALHLSGAMIANAKVNEKGELEDQGKLSLQVGEFFSRYIATASNGYIFRGAMTNWYNFAKDDTNPYRGEYHATLGAHGGSGKVYATVGEGEIIIREGKLPEEINRDITKPQEFDWDYEIDPLHLDYYSPNPKNEVKYNQETFDKIVNNLQSMPDIFEVFVEKGTSLSTKDMEQIVEENYRKSIEIVEADEDREEKNNNILAVSNNQDLAIRSIVFLDADNDNNNDYDIGFSVAPETESKLKIIGEKIGKLIAEYNLEVATQHAEGRRWFDDANVIGAIGYIWGSVYSDLKKSIPKEIKDLTAAIMALEDMSNNLEPNKDPMKVFNGLIEKNRQSLDKANGISPIFEGIAKHTKSAYSSAVTEIKDITATMMALEDMSTKVSQDTKPMEVFTMLVDQNRKALDNANGIAPIFQGIATGLNYATEGIASPTREVIEDVSIVVGGFEAGKLTYQSGRFIFRESPKICPKPINNFFKESYQDVDLPNKNLYNLKVNFPYKAQLVGEFDYKSYGSLDLKFTKTFVGHRYRLLILEEDITV